MSPKSLFGIYFLFLFTEKKNIKCYLIQKYNLKRVRSHIRLGGNLSIDRQLIFYWDIYFFAK